jgi:hypothetical protein
MKKPFDLISGNTDMTYWDRIQFKGYPVTIEQFLAWRKGDLIQNAMPNLTDPQREYIMTGIDNDEWEKLWEEVEETPNLDEED